MYAIAYLYSLVGLYLLNFLYYHTTYQTSLYCLHSQCHQFAYSIHLPLYYISFLVYYDLWLLSVSHRAVHCQNCQFDLENFKDFVGSPFTL